MAKLCKAICILLILTSCAGWEQHKANRTKIAAEMIDSKAMAGDVEAQYELGMMYAIGYNKALYQFPQDYVKAEKYLTMAANNNHAQAQFKLAELYFYGLGVPQDPQKGLALLTASANQGYQNAALLLQSMRLAQVDILIRDNPEEAKRRLIVDRYGNDMYNTQQRAKQIQSGNNQ